ncbi:8389_t:CDS:2 [Entrophospora sp. SA101]|nr:8389_t:CDS:2 [Entrophospora sp. SA101]
MKLILIPHYSNLIILTCFIVIYQLSFTIILADNPGVYFDATSKLLITGQYDGISEYDVIGQKESYDVSTASFIIQLANNNTYKLAGSTSTQGTINALCILPRSSDNNDNADVDVFIGGNFTSIGGITTNNIIRYDVTTDTFLSLLDGLDGAVHSLYCDKSNSIVYVGGLFSAPRCGYME